MLDLVEATMPLKNILVILSSVAAAIALLSCTAMPPASPTGGASLAQRDPQTELKAAYSALGEAGGRVFTLDPSKSTVRIYVFRGGRAAKAGHNHVLSAPQFTGFFYLPVAGASNGRFDLVFRLDQLEIDKPEYRSPLGSAFSSVLTPGDIKGLRAHMLGDNNLQADKFPFVLVHSLQVTGESPKFATKVQIEMHGQKHEMWIPLSVEGLPEHLSVAGSFVLRQTDFGVQPYSVLGGLLAVQDEVVIEFKLSGA
jgi:hypothetical protein